MAKRRRRRTLYHYTSEKGIQGILASRRIHPSIFARHPADARYGDGQYFSDLIPGTRSPSGLSKEFLGIPFQGRRFTHYVEIDVTELTIIEGRPHVFVIRNRRPLDITGRVVSTGKVEVS